MIDSGKKQKEHGENKIALDFSGLFDEQPTESDTEPLLGVHGIKTPVEGEKPLKRQTEGLEGQQAKQLYLQASKEREDHERSIQVYRKYQENIKTSSQLQTEILKGARAGEDIYNLFLKAVKTISLMTSNTVFYNQLEGDVKAIYGRGLGESPPLQTELKETEDRIQKLTESIKRNWNPEDKEKIRAAIREQKAQAVKIKEMIKGA